MSIKLINQLFSTKIDSIQLPKIYLSLWKKSNVIYFKLRQTPKSFITDSKTDIVLEGFPRSGNSFAYNLLITLDKDLNIAHHTHSIANLKLAKKYHIPSFVLIREPIEAISSLVVFRNFCHDDKDIRIPIYIALLEYTQFYMYVLEHISLYEIVKFELLKNNPTEFISIVSKTLYSSKNHYKYVNIENLVTQAKRNLKKNWNKQKVPPSKTTLPNIHRKDKKTRVKNEIQSFSKELNKCKKLYKKLVQK